MQLIIFGAPGAGKGTQSKILCERFNLVHLSTGDLLRKEVKTKSELGYVIKKILDAGELVPNNIVGELLNIAIKSVKNKDGYILDGFPRTVDQAKMLEGIFKENNFKKPIILFLTADEKVVIERLSNRRQCSECSSIVIITAVKDNCCPNCGAKNSLFKRDDDNEETIKNRLEVYFKTTFPVLKFFKDEGEKIIEVLGTDPIEKVTKNILAKVK
ncbi:MAG: adenylate kinase [Melioribacteraceae bacterium]|nr:adenylate kinase [Melioribacteraceae bacterium]